MLRAMVQHSASGLGCFDADGILTFANHLFSELLGRGERSPIGCHLRDVLKDSAGASCVALPARLLEEIPQEFVLESGTASDAVRWLEVILTPVPDTEGRATAGIVTLSDVTSRQEAEIELRLSVARLKRATEISTVGMVFFALQSGELMDANDAFLRMSGYQVEDFNCRVLRWDRLIASEWKDSWELARDELKQVGQTVRREFELTGRDGRRWWALFAATRLSADEGVAFVVDTTERNHAEKMLERYREELEECVQERTAELDEANGALRDEIVERKRAEAVRHELLRKLVDVQENERRHISRELHDEVGQHLTALMLGLKSLEGPSNDEAAAGTLRQLKEITETVGKEIHEMALQLRPTALDDVGLERTLANYVEQWSTRAGIEVDFHSSGWEGERLSSVIETTLYRIAQEALTNVLKHAAASQVSIILERHSDQAVVIVEDNGKGFAVDCVERHADRPPLGLLGMRERATLVLGELKIESTEGEGTTIFARVPFQSSPTL